MKGMVITMEKQKKELKNRYRVNIRPIVSLLIGLAFFSVILLVTMLETAGSLKHSEKTKADILKEGNQTDKSIASQNVDSEMLAVVEEIKAREQRITLYDIKNKETYTLSYTGASNVKDKYNQVISMNQIPIGTMVDAGYQKDDNKLIQLQISTKAWEYIGVDNLTIDRSARVMKIAGTQYKYTDDVFIIDGGTFIPVSNLAEQDELTIRGYEETIYSATVTRGHGTVKLEDYEAFLGANLSIGYEAMQQITQDMVMTVREGNFNLTVENGDYSATKNITIYRNQETKVSLGDLGPEAEKIGRIVFDLSPFGADLFIDGELKSYANPIELAYGDHAIEASLGGYTTYQGTLKVEEAGKTIKIDLPETSSGEEAVAAVTTPDQTGTAGNNSTTGDTDSTNTGEVTETTDNGEVITDEDHLVYVQKPIGASVYLDAEFKGISPVSFKKTIGTYVITFIMDGYETQSYTIEIPKDGLDTYFSFADLVKLK